MTSTQHVYTPEATTYIKDDDRYKRACDDLAEVLDLHPEVIERLAVEHDFIKAVGRLAHIRAMLAIEWQRRTAVEGSN